MHYIESDMLQHIVLAALQFSPKMFQLNMICGYLHLITICQCSWRSQKAFKDLIGQVKVKHLISGTYNNTANLSKKSNCIKNNQLICPHFHPHTHGFCLFHVAWSLHLCFFLSPSPPFVLTEQPVCEVRCQALLLLVDHDFTGRALNNSAGPHAPWERN